MKKAISFLLALVMALSLLPAAVWADNEAGGESKGSTTSQQHDCWWLKYNDNTTAIGLAADMAEGYLTLNRDNKRLEVFNDNRSSPPAYHNVPANLGSFMIAISTDGVTEPKNNWPELTASTEQIKDIPGATLFTGELSFNHTSQGGGLSADEKYFVYRVDVTESNEGRAVGTTRITAALGEKEIAVFDMTFVEKDNNNPGQDGDIGNVQTPSRYREKGVFIYDRGMEEGKLLYNEDENAHLIDHQDDKCIIRCGGKGITLFLVSTDLLAVAGDQQSGVEFEEREKCHFENEKDNNGYRVFTIYRLAVAGRESGQVEVTITGIGQSGTETLPFVFDFDTQGGDEPVEPWEPTEGIVPANAPKNLKALYDVGFKFPTIDVNGTTEKADIHFTFPQTLKAWDADCGDDWDYRLIEEADTGTIRIQVNMGDRGRWEQTVRGNDDVLDDGVFFRYYFGNSDNQRPMNYGCDWYGDYSGNESLNLETYTLSEQYNHNNGLHLASVNRVNAYSSVLTLNSEGEDWSIILAMDKEQKAMKDAACKYALRLVIEPCESTSFTLSADNGTAVEKDRITIEENSVHSDWEARVPADATVFLRPKSKENRQDANTYQYGIIAKMDVAPKAGYTLQRWINSAGPEGDQLPVSLVKDDYQTIRLIWKDASENIVTEYVRVECHNKAEWFRSLGSGTNPQVSIFTDAELAELEENGIHVTYAKDIGYFAVSVDASKLTNVDLLQKQIYLTHPEGAVYFKGYMPGGSENPATHNVSDSVRRAEEIFNDEDMIAAPISEYGDPSMSLVQVKELRLGDLTVYYTDFQMYRNLIVQWLDAAKEVIGYSYVYGRNGDFVTAVDTAVVDKLDNEEVEVPTLVTDKENLQFTCDKNPQTGSEDGRKLFLQFEVMDNSGENEPVYTVYLPYEYFNMTKEQGLALAAQGIKPTVTHYMDDACTTTKPIIDSAYTEYGVMIVTDSFSPYVIDCSAQNEDNGSSGNRYYYTGSGSSDSTITSGADQTKQAGDIVKVTVKSGAKVQTVYVDGVALSAGDYIISGGAVKLQGTYTVKLAQGSHTLRIAYSDGSAVSTTFTLKGTTAPKTGDAGIAVYAVMALGGCTGAAALAFRRKRED